MYMQLDTILAHMRYFSLLSTNPQTLGEVVQFLLQQSGKSETDLGKLVGATQPMINKAKLNQKALPSPVIDLIASVFGLNKEERELLRWLNLKARIIAKKSDGGNMLVEHYETEAKHSRALVSSIKAHCSELVDAVLEDPEHSPKRAVKLAHVLKKMFSTDI